MRSLKLIVAYDGTNYSGWQYQPNRPTIQGALEQAWQALTSETIRISGCGRTDAGVHAVGQVGSLVTESLLSCDTVRRGLNAYLPADIVVRNAVDVASDFHASKSARWKRYRYRLEVGMPPCVFERRYVWQLPFAVDDELLQQAGSILIGRHDFACFQSTGSPRDTTVRTIFEINVRVTAAELSGAKLVEIDVRGDGFLYHMVRGIVGTLVDVARGAQPIDWVAEVLASRDRTRAGRNAPPQGLFLMEVEY